MYERPSELSKPTAIWNLAANKNDESIYLACCSTLMDWLSRLHPDPECSNLEWKSIGTNSTTPLLHGLHIYICISIYIRKETSEQNFSSFSWQDFLWCDVAGNLIQWLILPLLYSHLVFSSFLYYRHPEQFPAVGVVRDREWTPVVSIDHFAASFFSIPPTLPC